MPGFGASAAAYAPGLPAGWLGLEPPAFARAEGFRSYLDWLGEELAARPGRTVLAGHSMGGALCMLAAALWPERVARLVLVAPAGLPLTKPMHHSAAQFVGQVATRRFSASESLRSLLAVATAPAAALRVALAVRKLDLSAQMRQVRELGTSVTVIGCTTDTLVTPLHCRRAATLLGARYNELPIDGGHMWMFGHWQRFRHELARAA